MSIRQNVVKTIKTVKEEYRKVDFGDKLLDLISIVGIVLFLVSFVSVFLSRVFNAANIVFMLYPLGLAGVAASFRMKKRDRPEDAEKLFKEWVWIFGTITVISIIVIIIGFVLA